MIPFTAGKSLIVDDLIFDFFNLILSKSGQNDADGLNLRIQAQPLFGVFPLQEPVSRW